MLPKTSRLAEPVFNGITTGTVVATAPGVSKGNITVNALQNVANTPGANGMLEQIVGPNANPVVLTRALNPGLYDYASAYDDTRGGGGGGDGRSSIGVTCPG